MWKSSEKNFVFVEVAPDDGTNFYHVERPRYYQTYLGKRVYGTLHQVRITGLEPGKRYRYAISSKEVIDVITSTFEVVDENEQATVVTQEVDGNFVLNANNTVASSQAIGTVYKSEPNILISYYANPNNATALRQTNYSHVIVDEYNRKDLFPFPLRFTTQEITLTVDMVNQHFAQIHQLSDQIDLLKQIALPQSSDNQQLCAAYLARAIEEALVQDYTSAIDDITRAILMDDRLYFAYFCRANWRYKQLEYKRAMGETTDVADFELMMRDYDYVIHHQPDFSFAYYNKANMLCLQKNYLVAINYYTQAIQADSDFAEAYFNRGLTYIYINEIDKGLADLSKAGELGIYQAYNLITRFQ